jgi:hypothetical protein
MPWIEFHYQSWRPRSFRDGVTDALQFILNLGGVCDPIVPRLSRAMESAGTHRIVDHTEGNSNSHESVGKVIREGAIIT